MTTTTTTTTIPSFTTDTALAALAAKGLDMRYVAKKTPPVMSDDGLCLVVKTKSIGGLLNRLNDIGVGAYAEDDSARLVAIFVSTLTE